jgi:hypothetical protein
MKLADRSTRGRIELPVVVEHGKGTAIDRVGGALSIGALAGQSGLQPVREPEHHVHTGELDQSGDEIGGNEQ